MRLTIITVLMCSLCATFALDSSLNYTSLQWDEIENRVKQSVKESATELIEQARLVENIAKMHIGATIRANAFEALKVVVNNAVKKLRKNSTRRASRQDEDEDETPEVDSEEERAASQAELQNAVKINENVFSFIGQTVKEVVSGITGTPVNSLGSTAEQNVKRKRPAYNYNPAAPYKLTRSENVTYGDFFEKNEQLFRQISTDTKGKPYSDQFMELVEILSNNTDSGRNSSSKGKPYIKESVDEILRYQPWLLPDLYKGAGELKGYLYTVERLVNQLNSKINQDQKSI